MAHPGGRPTIYTPELATIICERVATNPIGLRSLCNKFKELPHPDTIRVWRWEKPEFSSKYAEAKRFQAELMAESIEEVIEDTLQYVYVDGDGNKHLDSGILGRARLTIDSRKWQASKLAPKIYGERKTEESNNPQETLTKIQALVADLNKTNVSDA